MSRSVLIVDDAGFIRELLRRVCEAEGLHVVDEAEDGIQAIEKIKIYEPDIVFLDLVLPRAQGLEVMREFVDTSYQPHFIICTSLDDADAKRRAQALGCRYYLSKPFQHQQIAEIIDQLKNQARRTHHG
jgi:YesN/AraC family two-component response regulator